MKQPDEQLILAELVKLAAVMPKILAVAVVYRIENGWTVAFHTTQKAFHPDLISAKIGDFYRLANQIVVDLSLGEWRYYISIGTEATGILLPLTSSYGLVVIIQPETPLNDLISTLEPYCESLLKYLDE